MLIQNIDAITRSKKRGVLYLIFKNGRSEPFHVPDYDNLPDRTEIIQWLDSNQIAWKPCAEYASPNRILPYRGQIYIDIPYDKNLPAYQKLESFLELPDASMRFKNVTFAYLPLDRAKLNDEHDEPGIWDKWKF